MSQCRKEWGFKLIPKYLVIFSIGLCLIVFSGNVFAQDSSRKHPEPPPHPKHKSLKEMLDKINIFKKKKKDNPDNNNTTEVEDKKHDEPPPPPPPDPVKPKVTAKTTHKSTKSKAKRSTKPAAKKVTQPII